MTVIRVYLALYGACFQRALQGIARNAWTLLLPIGLCAGLFAAASLAMRLGIVGAIILGLVLDALSSSYLYFTGEIVAQSRARLRDLKTSLGRYFWAVMGVGFFIWIGEALLGAALASNRNGWIILLLARFTLFVLANPLPEVLYQKQGGGSLAALQYSIGFVHQSWIEWFVPNVIVCAGFYYLVFGLLELGIPFFVVAILAGGLFHLLMVFRGHLFAELDGGSHRQRMYKWRQTHPSDELRSAPPP